MKKLLVGLAVFLLLAIFFGGLSNMLHTGTDGLSNVMSTVQTGSH